MTKRKTVNVEDMLEQFNNVLASSAPKDTKIGIATAIEIMLMSANRYNGFQYLDKNGDSNTEYNRIYFAKNP